LLNVLNDREIESIYYDISIVHDLGNRESTVRIRPANRPTYLDADVVFYDIGIDPDDYNR
jgi:alanine dehydrogenase